MSHTQHDTTEDDRDREGHDRTPGPVPTCAYKSIVPVTTGPMTPVRPRLDGDDRPRVAAMERTAGTRDDRPGEGGVVRVGCKVHV